MPYILDHPPSTVSEWIRTRHRERGRALAPFASLDMQTSCVMAMRS
jgi:hypothetical protein